MRPLRLVAPPLLLAVALASGCGPRREAKVPPRFSPDQIRDQREALDALQAQAETLAISIGEIQALSVQINTIQTDVEELRILIARHRDQLEKFMAATPTPRRPDWLTNVLVFLFGVAVASIVYFGFRLIHGYDEGDLPPEAYTPGMAVAGGPTGQEPTDPESPGGANSAQEPSERPAAGQPPESTA